MKRLSWVLALVLTLPGLASAQEMTAAQREEARGLFEAGRAAFADGRYADALGYFERSYAISELPELLYNIGHTADRLRDDRRALEAFEAYLEARPDTEGRASIDARIVQLRELVAAEDAREAERAELQRSEREAAERAAAAEAAAAQSSAESSAESSAAPDTAAASSASEPSIAGWFVAGGGAAVALAGAILLGLAESEAGSVRDAPAGTPWLDVEGAHARADAFGMAGGVLLGVGLAAAVAGVIWGAVEISADTQVAFGPGSVSVRGRL